MTLNQLKAEVDRLIAEGHGELDVFISDNGSESADIVEFAPAVREGEGFLAHSSHILITN